MAGHVKVVVNVCGMTDLFSPAQGKAHNLYDHASEHRVRIFAVI